MPTPLSRQQSKDAAGPTYRDLFANHVFVRLWIGQVISYGGDALSRVAFPLYVLHITGSAVALGITFALQQIPWVIISPWAGVIADRYSRKVILIMTTLMQALCIGMVGWFTSLWAIALLAFLSATAQVIHLPARSAALPDLIDPHLYPRAVAVSGMTAQALDIVGVMIGGALVALFGAITVFWIDAITFVVNAALIGSISIAGGRSSPQRQTTWWTDWIAGTHFILTQLDLRRVVGIMVLRGMTVTAILPLIPAFVSRDIGAGAWGVGVFAGMLSVGLVLSSWLAIRLEQRTAAATILIWGSAGAALWFVPFGWVRSWEVLLICYGIVGLFYGAGNLVANVEIARLAPTEVRGRVTSTTWMGIKCAQAGAGALFGAIAGSIGVPMTITIAVMILLGGCIAIAVFRSSRSLIHSTPAHPERG